MAAPGHEGAVWLDDRRSGYARVGDRADLGARYHSEFWLAGDLHVRRVPEAAERPVRLEPRANLAGIHADGADGGGLLAVHRPPGGPGGRAQGSVAVRG